MSPSLVPANQSLQARARDKQVVSAELLGQIVDMVAASQAQATTRAYIADWDRFDRWCKANSLTSLPATDDTMAGYLTESANMRRPDGDRDKSVATLSRWLASVNYFHRAAGLTPPGDSQMVRSTLAGIRRTYAAEAQRPVTRRAPLRTADITQIVATARGRARTWSQQGIERRHSALLWMGYVAAMRRSELAGLLFTDVKPHQADGLHLRVRRSKTDQSGRGHVKVVPYGSDHLSCPVCAYWRWHEVVCAQDADGRVGVMRVIYQASPFTGHVCGAPGTVPPDPRAPLFRPVHRIGTVSDRMLSGAGVHGVIRRRAAAAGFTPEQVAELGGHSLRAGFVTEALSSGASAHEVMRQTGHTSPATIEIYAREHAPIENNAVTRLGL